MTNEEAIRILEADCHSPFPFTPDKLDEACRVGADALRAQKTKMDRSRWEGCVCCTLPVQIRVRKRCDYRYCEHCGRPLTEEAWAELERGINDGTADL